MSTLKVSSIQNPSTSSGGVSIDTSGHVTVDGVAMPSEGPLSGTRNRIINGDMRIDQRNAGASVTPSSTVADTYSLDRWCSYGSAASKFSIQQNGGSITPPSGHRNYLGVTSLAATTVGSSDQYYVAQYVEGFNTADLMLGSASAVTVTISFWVCSSLTGTFGGSLANSAFNRSYPFTYSISSANTWEQKTVTIAGDTSGTWLTTNGVGLRVHFGLGVGSALSGTSGAWASSAFVSATGATSVVGTNGATFYITGVQLEAGSVATPFERRSYGQELALCERYGELIDSTTGNYAPIASGYAASTTVAEVTLPFRTKKRAAPTATYSSASGFLLAASNGSGVAVTSISTNRVDVNCLCMNVNVASGLAAGNGTRLFANNTANPSIFLAAEL